MVLEFTLPKGRDVKPGEKRSTGSSSLLTISEKAGTEKRNPYFPAY
jgi:hypothetical protein